MLHLFTVLTLSLAPAAAGKHAVLVEGMVDAAGKPRLAADVFFAETQPGIGIKPQFLERVRSDRQGRFRSKLADGPLDRTLTNKPWALWAHVSGQGVASCLVPRDWPAGGPHFRLSLPPPVKVALQVVGPDGASVANVRVLPAGVLNRAVPDELAEILAVTTDREGRATLSGFAADDLELVRLVARGYGTQQIALPLADAAGIRRLALRAVGRIEGRITAADKKAVGGLKIYAESRLDISDPAGVGGIDECVTAADGRFVISALAEGTLTLRFVPHLDLPFRGKFDNKPEVAPGQTTKVNLELKRAVLVKGVVQEQRTGKPIAGALVRLDWSEGIPRVRTDEQGRYSGYVDGWWAGPYVTGLPKPYVSTNAFIDTQSIPTTATEFTSKPLLLAAGGGIRGRVVDDAGKPVAGARVTGAWGNTETDSWMVTTRSGSDGNFLLDGVDARTEIRVGAEAEGASALRPVLARTTDKEPVTVVISRKHAVALAGRVVDRSGKPLAGIAIQILSGERKSTFRSVGARIVEFAGRSTLRTGANGRFRTPRQLHPDPVYRVQVDHPGFIITATEWVEPEANKDLTLPDIILIPAPRLRTVSGRVVDRQGRPVRKAIVLQSGDGPRRTRTVCDDEGRFQLPGVFEGRAYLFVESPGFRFRGYAVEISDKPVHLTLQRREEPLKSPLAPLPAVLRRAKERALARRLLDPILERVAPGSWNAMFSGSVRLRLGSLGPREQFSLLDIVPRLEPGGALALADRGLLESYYSELLRSNALEGLLDESPAEALAIAETLKAPHERVRAYISASDHASADRARRRELLETAQLYARAETDPGLRVEGFGKIALRWLELGEAERARRLLREGQKIAEKLPAPTSANRRTDVVHYRGRFAAKLARIDTQAALTLAKGWTDETYHDWYIGGVALGCAQRDPDEAVKVLAMLHSDSGRKYRLARICGRIAVKDLRKARELTNQLTEPSDRIAALTHMARALAKRDPVRAEKLLEEIDTAYAKMLRDGKASQGGFFSICAQAAVLLMIAEEIGPECLERCFWRTLAMRPNRPSRGDPGDPRRGYEPAIGQLAIMLARYERAVARTVLEPVALRSRYLLDGDEAWAAGPLFSAAAVIDPDWAVELVNALPDDPSTARLRPKDVARRTVARVLAHGGARQWEFLLQNILYLRDDSTDDER
jgi:protocatechuate 3,4-dioxygenase beta subunit